MRDHMDRRVTSSAWGPPPPRKQALNMLIQVSLRAVHKEICRKGSDIDLTEISFEGQFKLEPHPHWPPSGVQF